MKKTNLALCLAALSLLLFVSCAGPNSAVNTPASNGYVSGFWSGLWHGMIVGITFIISLFSNRIHFYEVHNNGNWYNIGFMLGGGIVLQIMGGAISRIVVAAMDVISEKRQENHS